MRSLTQGRAYSGLSVIACFLLAVALYLPAATILPFSDDWQMSAWAEQHGWNVFFSGANFRFWTRVVYAAGHPWLGEWIGLLIIPLSLASLLGAGWILFDATRRLAPHLPWAPAFVVALYLLHPANVSAVIQGDTIGQALADVLMLLCIRQMVFVSPVQTPRSVALAVLLILATLFGKETALGVLAWIPVVVVWRALYVERLELRLSLHRGTIALVTIVLGIALFFWIRAAAGTPLTPSQAGRYAINLDWTIVLMNLLHLAGGGLYFGDTAQVFMFGLNVPVVISGLLSVVLALLAWRGWHAAKDSRRAGGLAPSPDLYLWSSFYLPATAPMFLMGSVSELYLAGMTPFVALIFGVYLAQLTHMPGGGMGIAAGVVVASAVFWGGFSVVGKISMRRDASERAWAYVREVTPLFSACDWPTRSIVVEGNLADTTTGGRAYSAFSVMNERLLRSAIFALADPFRRTWIVRAAARQEDAAAAECSVQLADQPAQQCILTCEAGRSPGSETQRCRVLEQRCSDTRH